MFVMYVFIYVSGPLGVCFVCVCVHTCVCFHACASSVRVCACAHVSYTCDLFPCLRLCLALDLEEELEDRWVLQTGRQYHVTVRIHDSHGHVLHMSEVPPPPPQPFLTTLLNALSRPPGATTATSASYGVSL